MNLEKTTGEVLLADDDPDDRLLTQNAFKRGKVRKSLRCLGGGEELLRRLRDRDSDKPSLILLDLNMPKMDGFEVLGSIKSDPSLREIPVVVLSTSNDQQDIHKSYVLGANSFITKPSGLVGYEAMVASLSGYWFGTVTLADGNA